jgi:hypothetical protein
MEPSVVTALVWVAAIVVVVGVLFASRRGGGSRPGPGTIGTVYDWLNEDKRKAIEIIVEERAEARDPEHKDGNLPDLEDPRKSP